MSIVAKPDARWRWEIVLHGPKSLGEDLGLIGTWVGPRTGAHKRTQGQMEDYVLRRLLVAWREQGALECPLTISAERMADGEPDFLVSWPDGRTLGIEITEAGKKNYQAWLTHLDRGAATDAATGQSVPLEASTERTVSEIAEKIRKKIAKYEAGSYHAPDGCDLVVYDNTAWGGFLDKRTIVDALLARNDLRGKFRRLHLVFESMVFLDLFGDCRRVDLRSVYEVDYAGWVFDQVERLRRERPEGFDWASVAEELEDLGKSERRALASHLRNVLIHLLKWQFQPSQRSESWRLSISNGRLEVSELLIENPSFRVELDSVVRRQYALARGLATRETNLPLETFPEEPPYSTEQILDIEFWPDGSELGSDTTST
jgi:hypothetical protein